MKWASEIITPGQVVFYRVLFGFIPVAIFAWRTKVFHRSHIKLAGHFGVMALLATAIYYYGFAKGAALLPSGTAGALSGAIPLFTFIAGALFLPDEKPTRRKLVGITSGFIGVALIANPMGTDFSSTSFGANLEGAMFMILGSSSLGISFVYAKKFLARHEIKAVALTTYQLGIGLFIIAVATDFTNINAIWTAPTISAGLVIGLGLLGTGLAYIAYYYIVGTLGAISAASVTYIPPVVALMIGSVLVHEDIEWSAYPATALIFAGVWLLKDKK